jgi:hypothetical protein
VSASGGILKRQMIAALQKTRQFKLKFGVFITFNEKYKLSLFHFYGRLFHSCEPLPILLWTVDCGLTSLFHKLFDST